ERGDVRRKLAIIKQSLVKPGRKTVCQDRGRESKLGVTGIKICRRMPCKIGTFLRYAVTGVDDLFAVHHHASLGGAIKCGPRRDRSEVLLDKTLCLSRIKITGDHERKIV